MPDRPGNPENSATAARERICPRCEYRTALPVARCPVCDLPLREQPRTWTEQRRAPRIALPPGIQGELGSSVAVGVVDLSALGARLEHPEPLLPGQPTVLTLPLPGRDPLRLPARVVWSRAEPIERRRGQTEWIYRSGVEFWNLPAAAARDLAVYLDQAGIKQVDPVSGTVALPAGEATLGEAAPWPLVASR